MPIELLLPKLLMLSNSGAKAKALEMDRGFELSAVRKSSRLRYSISMVESCLITGMFCRQNRKALFSAYTLNPRSL